MKTTRLSTTPTTTTNNSTSVGSRLFSTPKPDSSPINFENEKELTKKLEEISSDFKNKEKDWSFRLKSLQVLQRIINGNGIEFKGWSSLLRSVISPGLIEQLTELRSTIVKEACQSVSLLCQRMKNKFEPFALLYIQPLIRMVPVKTTVIAESAHQSIKDILESVQTKNLLSVFLDASLDQHNEQLRKRSAEYIYIILNRAIDSEGMILVSSIPALEKSIQKLLVDGASETRQVARYCFWSYIELNEKSATALFYQFTPTTQKNLFTVMEHLQGEQLEMAEKLKKSLFEEEQDQKMIEDLDMDIDLNDFKKTNSSTGSSGGSGGDILRSKTPTSQSGRASGLKSRVPVKTPIGSTTDSLRRAGSSLSNRDTASSSSSTTTSSSSIKKPLDASLMIRSKSSLGTTRKLDSGIGSGSSSNLISSTLTSTTTSTSTTSTSTTSSPLSKTIKTTSPNLSTQSLSGRYSSIGTRGTTSASSLGTTSSLSKMPSSSNLRTLPPINKSPVSPPSPLPPQPTLTKSKSTPSSPLTTKSSLSASTTPIKKSTTASTPTTPNTPGIKKPISTGLSSPSTKTSSSSSSSTKSTTTNKGLSSSSTLTPTKKSFITKSAENEDDIKPPTKSTTSTPKSSNPTTTTTTTTTATIDVKRKSITSELDLESLEISLNQDNSLAFHEISEELSNTLKDVKKGLSFYEEELTLDDLEINDGGSKRNSVSTFKNRIKKANTADLEFNWLEDSVHDSLIEDDVLDFNEENNDEESNGNNNSNSNSSYSSKSNLSSNKNNIILEEDEQLDEIQEESEEQDAIDQQFDENQEEVENQKEEIDYDDPELMF